MITFDGKQVFVTKQGLDNMQVVALLEVAKGIMMRETLGNISKSQQGAVIGGAVAYRPSKVGS